MKFSDNEVAKIINLCESYIQAKALILYAEEIDPKSKSNIQIIKELRDAFDHLMYTFYGKCQTDPELKIAYSENIDKAIGHVYRATFDALDGAVVSLKELISETLNNYPPEVIEDVIGGYWQIKIDVMRISDKVAKHREKKTHENNNGGVLDSYVEDLEKLKTIYTSILDNGQLLDECFKRLRKKSIKNRIVTIAIGLFIGISCTLFGWWLKTTSSSNSILDVGQPPVSQNE